MASKETHLRVLRLLQANPHMTQRELADALGVSLGKANYCMRELLVKGLIKMRNFSNSRNKLSYAYLLTPSGVAAKARLTAEYLRIKVAEYESLEREIAQLRVETSDRQAKEGTR
ncbi:MAG: MarR family EPS-associated transcriptional regulator [Steroidobacteraceae bacterium]